MKLVCLSDTHGTHESINVPDGDVLIHSGDLTNFGTLVDLIEVADWMKNKQHKHKIMICGNHEKEVSENTQVVKNIFEPRGIKVLHEKTLIIDGVKFWGQPRTPEFCGWGWSYFPGQEAEEIWARMPDDTDILICHGPPLGIADACPAGVNKLKHVGCPAQLKRIQVVKPKLVICGHIHYSYGVHSTDFETVVINAAICAENYNPTNKPIVVKI